MRLVTYIKQFLTCNKLGKCSCRLTSTKLSQSSPSGSILHSTNKQPERIIVAHQVSHPCQKDSCFSFPTKFSTRYVVLPCKHHCSLCHSHRQRWSRILRYIRYVVHYQFLHVIPKFVHFSMPYTIGKASSAHYTCIYFCCLQTQFHLVLVLAQYSEFFISVLLSLTKSHELEIF